MSLTLRKTFHKDMPTYKCVACSSGFSFRKSLYAHLKEVHNYKEGPLLSPQTSVRTTKKYEVCEICEMVFSNVREHKKAIHGIIVEEAKSLQLRSTRVKVDRESLQQLCSVCGGLFASAAVMKKHLERVHSKLENSDNLSGKKYHPKVRKSRIQCPNCKIGFLKTYTQLINHLKSEHKIEIHYEELHFDSVEEFEKWKKGYEDTHYVLYIKDCAPKPTANTSKRLYYNCHRSYEYRKKSKIGRAQKLIGTNKTGSACPSHIKVIIQDDKCVVHFWKTHVGHVAELQRCTLRKEVRAEIASKIERGIPIQKILDETRNSLVKGGVMNRVHLLNRKDIYNISRDYQIEYNRENGTIDTNLTLWVEHTRRQPESPIIYFKNVGDTDDETSLLKEDFALMLVVSSQIPPLQKFGKKVICVDQIPYPSGYDLNLYIIMTVDDELEWACAAAFCFSNRSDETIFQIFFEKVKNCFGKLVTATLISDQNAAIYKSWNSVMSEPPNYFWSTWHIDQDWKLQTKTLIKEQKIAERVRNILKTLHEVDNEHDFKSMLADILEDFSQDHDLTSFSDYFVDQYVNFTEFWGLCFRCHNLELNIETHFKSLHTVFEKVCLRMSKQHQFVRTIEAILKTARDNYFQHIVKVSTCKHDDKKHQQRNKNLNIPISSINSSYGVELEDNILSRIEDSHYKSEAITSDMIISLRNENEWMIFTGEPSKQMCYVHKLNLLCVNCDIRCDKCKICIHNFSCSCNDYTNNNNICSHIHALANFLIKCKKKGNNSTQDTEILTTCDSDVFEIMYVQDQDQIGHKKSFIDEVKHKSNLILALSEHIVLNENDQQSVLNQFNQIISVYQGKHSM